MSSAQIKLNEIIRLCTDLSTSIHDNTDDNILQQNPTSNSVDNKINYDIISTKKDTYSNKLMRIDFNDSYSIGELYIRCLGTCDDNKHNNESTKWCSVIEKTEEKCYILRGELMFPFKVFDIIYRDNKFTYIIDFKSVKWENDDIPELLESKEEEEEEEEEEEDGDYDEQEEDDNSDEEEEDNSDEEEENSDDEEDDSDNEGEKSPTSKASDETSEEIIVKKEGKIHLSLV